MRMEIKGDVIVTQKESTATGDNGVFDMKANTVTLNGNVVITRGQDVLRGQSSVVDLTSGVSRMEGGRVEGLFQSTPRDPNGGGGGGIGLPGPPPPPRRTGRRDRGNSAYLRAAARPLRRGSTARMRSR